jgi:acyl-CoA synthetase (NDP forming)
VRIGVSPADVLGEAEDMIGRVEAAGERIEGFVLQEQIDDGVEMLVGVVADPVFGPVVACGGGGVTVELQRDVAVRVAPLTDLDADEMVRSLASFPLLDGFRGAPKADVGALLDAILRIGALADAHPEIAEMDCNPVMVLADGVRVVDTRTRIQLSRPATPFASRSAAG